MHIETRKSGEVVILDLKGRLTAGLGDQIVRESIDELLAEGRRRILLNLSEVSFLDSAGVGELVAGLKTSRRFQADLKLRCAVGVDEELSLWRGQVGVVRHARSSRVERE